MSSPTSKSEVRLALRYTHKEPTTDGEKDGGRPVILHLPATSSVLHACNTVPERRTRLDSTAFALEWQVAAHDGDKQDADVRRTVADL